MINDLKEAINMLADGHSWYKVEWAEELCKAFGLELPKNLIETYHSQHDANPTNHYKGLFFNDGVQFPVSGVSALPLSDYITNQILGHTPSANYLGRGFGAQANAQALKTALKL